MHSTQQLAYLLFFRRLGPERDARDPTSSVADGEENGDPEVDDPGGENRHPEVDGSSGENGDQTSAVSREGPARGVANGDSVVRSLEIESAIESVYDY